MQKILININDLKEMDEYKKIGISNFLFAIPEFSHTYKTFELNSIPDNAYILINRLLDCNDVDNLKKIKNKLLRFKGIIFEDISVYQIFKDTSLELIWNQVHFASNISSVNFWLNKVSSTIISNELTKEEIENIVNNAIKGVIVNIFGINNIMYSRRTLLTNFNKYNNLDKYNKMNIINGINNFRVYEDNHGTYIYNNEYFNYINKLELNDDKIKFYYINNLDYKPSEIKEILDGKNIGNDGFLYKKTVYKLKDYTSKGGVAHE